MPMVWAGGAFQASECKGGAFKTQCADDLPAPTCRPNRSYRPVRLRSGLLGDSLYAAGHVDPDIAWRQGCSGDDVNSLGRFGGKADSRRVARAWFSTDWRALQSKSCEQVVRASAVRLC